jgi:hypothetical protein
MKIFSFSSPPRLLRRLSRLENFKIKKPNVSGTRTEAEADFAGNWGIPAPLTPNIRQSILGLECIGNLIFCPIKPNKKAQCLRVSTKGGGGKVKISK